MKHHRHRNLGRWTLAAVGMLFLLNLPVLAWANHAVLVEGELDFDGDMMVGLAEDNDGDVVFGTITRALGAAPALGQNGTAFIVTSGRFIEVVNIMGAGQVTLEASPGVTASIEAFIVAADRRIAEFPTAQANPFALQSAPGIVINSPDDRFVILRNISVVNWTDGIRINGNSHVLLDNVRVEHNINNGVLVSDNADVAIVNSHIAATGFRLNPMTGNFPAVNAPNTGDGVVFQGRSRGIIFQSALVGNFGEGLDRRGQASVRVEDSISFDNEREDDLPAPTMPLMMMTPSTPSM